MSGRVQRAALIALLTLPILISLSRPGWFATHEEDSYPIRLVEVARCWEEGFLSARWFPDLYFGQGYPFLSFYAPLFFVIAGLFHVAAVPVLASLKITLALGTFLGTVGAYRLIRTGFPAHAAFAGAALYTFAPYHVLNLFTRGDLSEYFAMGLLPWCLLTVLNLRKTPTPRNVVLVSVAGAATILSHNVLALFAGGAMAAAGVTACVSADRPLRTAAAAAAAGAGALLLSAFFWAPALHERQWVHIDALIQGNYSVFAQFVTLKELLGIGEPGSATRNAMRLEIGTLSLVLALLVPLSIRGMARGARALLGLALFLLVVSTLLMTSVATSVYEHVELLQFVQFPWRLLSVASLGSAVLAAAGVAFLAQRRGARGRALTAALVSVVSIASVWDLIDPGKLRPAEQVRLNPADYRADAGTTSRVYEYLPVWVTHGREPVGFRDGVRVDGAATVENVRRTVGRYRFLLSAQEPVRVTLRDLYYPGWRGQVGGQEIPLRPAARWGNLEFDLPAGHHDVQVHLGSTPVRRRAGWISALTALGLALALVPGKWARRLR